MRRPLLPRSAVSLAAVSLALLVACSGGDRPSAQRAATTTTEVTLPETVAVPTTAPVVTPGDYLGFAIDIIQDNAYYGRRVDWPAVRAEASRRAAGSATFADTYDAISWVIAQLGDRHSHLEVPGDIRRQLAPPTTQDLPKTTPLPERIASLHIPAISGPTTTPRFARYVEAAEVAVRAHPDACGWVVDLRGNEGGNMLAMLLAVGPILGEGDAILIRNGRGDTQRFSYRDGRVRFDGKLAPGPRNSVPPRKPLPPIAVVTDKETASSAEFLLLAFRGRADTRSFGEPTAGVPTANDSFRLPDNALIVLTIAVGEDRAGRLYEGPIAPDEHIDPAAAPDAAARWLRQTEPCRPPEPRR